MAVPLTGAKSVSARREVHRFVVWTVGILLASSIGAFSTFFGFHIFVDFPWFLEQNPETRTVSFGYCPFDSFEPGAPRIQVFLDMHESHASGMWSGLAESDTDELHVVAFAGNSSLRREGEILLVDGQRLAPGQECERTSYWHPHPWVKSRLRFRNLGVVTLQDFPGSPPRLVVHGTCGTMCSLEKGGVIVVGLAGALWYTIRRRRRVRDWRASR